MPPRISSAFELTKNEGDRKGYLLTFRGEIVLWTRLKCWGEQARKILDGLLPVCGGVPQEKTVVYLRKRIRTLQNSKDKLTV